MSDGDRGTFQNNGATLKAASRSPKARFTLKIASPPFQNVLKKTKTIIRPCQRHFTVYFFDHRLTVDEKYLVRRQDLVWRIADGAWVRCWLSFMNNFSVTVFRVLCMRNAGKGTKHDWVSGSCVILLWQDMLIRSCFIWSDAWLTLGNFVLYTACFLNIKFHEVLSFVILSEILRINLGLRNICQLWTIKFYVKVYNTNFPTFAHTAEETKMKIKKRRRSNNNKRRKKEEQEQGNAKSSCLHLLYYQCISEYRNFTPSIDFKS